METYRVPPAKLWQNASSCIDELLFIVNFRVKPIELFDQGAASEWHSWLLEIWLLSFYFGMELLPLLVQVLSVFFILFDRVLFLLLSVHLESLIKCKWINFLQDSFQSDERFLQNLMPMVLCEVHNDWNKHWECFIFIGL